MSTSLAWFAVLGSVLLTVYGQLVIKWRVLAVHTGSFFETLVSVLKLFTDPWTLSAFVAAFGASICWMLAMTKLPLSLAYPFTSLAILIVTISSIVMFQETVSISKWIGAALVVAGLLVLFWGQGR